MMFLFSYFDHRFLRRMVKLGYVVCLILLVLVLFSSPINGCRRWISFGGLTLQASEVAKFEMILLTADIAARTPQIKFGEVPLRKWVYHSIVVELIRPILWLVPVLILLVLEPHMSGILLTTAIVGTILLLGGNGGIITWAGAATGIFPARPSRACTPSAQAVPRGWGWATASKSSSGCRRAPTTLSSVSCARNWASSAR